MRLQFGKGGWIEKARQQPDKVRLVLQSMRTRGVMQTWEAMRFKLDQPVPLGYCNVGIAMKVARDVRGFSTGHRRVELQAHRGRERAGEPVCARAGGRERRRCCVHGPSRHRAPRHCLVQPTLGEAVVLTGLGLIGLLTVQLLRAHGCRVLGIDFDESRLELARVRCGLVHLRVGHNPIARTEEFSRGRGVDAVIITASSSSNEPVHQAALMSHKRGRIVLVGVTGLELSRADFYEKELSFQVSCSYGPRRYDEQYEEKGQDYPIGFVRWTEQRNFEAVLDMLADARLDVKPLISHRFPVDNAEEAYALVGGSAPSLGIALDHPAAHEAAEQCVRTPTISLGAAAPQTRAALTGVVGFVGAGNYAIGALIPAFKAAQVTLKTVASKGGVSGVYAGRKFDFEHGTTDIEAIFADPNIDTVVVATRHDSDATLVARALRAGKHVLVDNRSRLVTTACAKSSRRMPKRPVQTVPHGRVQRSLRVSDCQGEIAARCHIGAPVFRNDGERGQDPC